MTSYSFVEVNGLSFEALGKIDDPLELMSTGFVSPILARYVVRTGQLDIRYPNIDLPALLMAINFAATSIPWPLSTVAQKAPLAIRDPDVDAYLDQLAGGIASALKYIFQSRGNRQSDDQITQSLALHLMSRPAGDSQ